MASVSRSNFRRAGRLKCLAVSSMKTFTGSFALSFARFARASLLAQIAAVDPACHLWPQLRIDVRRRIPESVDIDDMVESEAPARIQSKIGHDGARRAGIQAKPAIGRAMR